MTVAPNRDHGGEHSVVDDPCPFLVVDLCMQAWPDVRGFLGEHALHLFEQVWHRPSR